MLLVLGMIFAVPTFDDCNYDTDDSGPANRAKLVEDNALMIMWDVQFYRVVNVQCTRRAKDDNVIIGKCCPTAKGGRRIEYIILPLTHLVLLQQ